MSLIQDALKRKSEEAEGVPPPAAIPAILSGESSPDEKRPRSLVIILIVLLAAGLLAALTGLSLYLIKPKQKPIATRTIINVSAAKPPVVQETPPVKAAAPEVAKAPVEPAAQPVPAPEIKPVWPELKLTGIAQSGSQRLAVLNGKMLPVGRKLGGVTLVEVNDSHIVVEYGGERRLLYVNE